MIEAKIINGKNSGDILLPNEPFTVFGKMVVSRVSEHWSYESVRFSGGETFDMRFPDEKYELSDDTVYVGAYDGEKCVGLAVLKDSMFRYLCLYDLKVNADYRRQGVGKILIEKAKEIALERGYIGVSTIGQDNNLAACLFYLKRGFAIGGLDTNVYKGTSQEGKSDIIFYLDVKED